MNDPKNPLIAAGAVIDGFQIGAALHEGARGTIFEVLGDHAFPRILKAPRIGHGDPAESLLAYETEAMLMPVLTGEHVPRFVAAGDMLRTPYVVMERIEGNGLASLLGKPFPAERVAAIGAAIADALHDLHRQGVIHLDLKPDNVILRPDGRAVLIDFGLAHHARLPDLLAEEGRFLAGSTSYVSPEQVQGSRSDLRSDLFALGVLLYEAATGELPFGTPASMAGIRDRLWLDPVPPATRNPALPPWLQEVILRALEPDATTRYQTAAHIAFDLRHPEQIMLTERASRRRSDGVVARGRRWLAARNRNVPRLAVAERPRAPSPIVMVAVDTMHPDDPRQPALQEAARRTLMMYDEVRVLCISIVSAGPLVDTDGDSASAWHLEHLSRLRHWSRSLGLPPEQLSLHVMEGLGAVAALVRFAKDNHVDLIIVGAPVPGERGLAWWRSVASGVTANAHCSVHVVRVHEPADHGGEDERAEDHEQRDESEAAAGTR